MIYIYTAVYTSKVLITYDLLYNCKIPEHRMPRTGGQFCVGQARLVQHSAKHAMVFEFIE